MNLKRKTLIAFLGVLFLLLIQPFNAFAEPVTANKSTLSAISAIEASNGKIVIKLDGNANSLTADDFIITTTIQGEACMIPDLTFNPENNTFSFTSLYNKTSKRHVLLITVSANPNSTRLLGSASAKVILKPHGGKTIKPGDKIVLTWGQIPKDLDANLILPDNGEICYWNKQIYDIDNNLIAELDKDILNGYGPEVITIYKTTSGVYNYYVINWDNYGYNEDRSLSQNGARVEIYNGNELITTFNAPENQPGYLWDVFKIENYSIIPVNSIHGYYR
jgi:hypothetical protein